MAVERVWFPHAPDGSIDASDRARQGIGYGGIAIAPPTRPQPLFGIITVDDDYRGIISVDDDYRGIIN